MSERRSSIVLGDKPESMLGALPLPERDWEKLALAVEARLPETASGSTDATLLAAPLPQQPGEPDAAPLAHSGVRTQSLAEIARQSLSRDAESDAKIAKASLALAARGRAQTEELAEKLRQSTPPPAAEAPVDLSDSVQAVEEPAAPAPLSQAKPGLSGNQLGYWVGAGGALLALAAAVALWLRPAPAPLIVTQVVEQKDTTPAATPAAPTAEPKAIDPSALAREASGAPAAPAATAAVAVAAARPSVAPGGAAASAATSAGPAPDKIVLEDDKPNAPAAKTDATEQPAQQAEPAKSAEPVMRPADNTTAGSLPAKPSMGAVQSAMSGVMSAARRCLAGESEPSNALVVFGSDGRVSHVTVTGSAAGKPAAACIQAALSKAQTSPFAESSFSFSTTVRP